MIPRKKLIVGATATIFGAGVVCSLLAHASHPPAAPQKVDAIPVTQTVAITRDVPVWVNAIGTIQADNTITVHSRVDGQLEKLGFKEGQPVHEGQLLAELDPLPFDAQVHQAEANRAKDAASLSTAQVNLTRYKALQQHGAASGQTAEDLQGQVNALLATVKADDAALEYAKLQRSYATLKSPITGRAGLRNVDVGNIVHASDANGIVVLTQESPITAVFGIGQDEVQNLQGSGGQKVAVEAYSRDGTTKLADGELSAIDNLVDVSTGQAKAKASFTNADGKLFPGELVSLRMRSHIDSQVVTVPSSALQYGQKGTYLFVTASNNTVSRRQVSTGTTDGSDVVITKGLLAGEPVVVSGQFRLQDGSLVRPDVVQGAH
jgi:multidrug efflux system membrane fusion protein